MLMLGHSVEHIHTASILLYITRDSSLMRSITNARLHKYRCRCVALHTSLYGCRSDALKPSFETSAWAQLHDCCWDVYRQRKWHDVCKGANIFLNILTLFYGRLAKLHVWLSSVGIRFEPADLLSWMRNEHCGSYSYLMLCRSGVWSSAVMTAMMVAVLGFTESLQANVEIVVAF
jgi:hypothetical protein